LHTSSTDVGIRLHYEYFIRERVTPPPSCNRITRSPRPTATTVDGSSRVPVSRAAQHTKCGVLARSALLATPPSSLALTPRWELRTAFHHGELCVVKCRLAPMWGLIVRRPMAAANFNRTLVRAFMLPLEETAIAGTAAAAPERP
jgi:hypothetical protein